MRVLVYGAGPQGSYIAYQLRDSGVDVTVLARGKRLEYIERYGIILEAMDSGKRTSRKVDTMGRLYPEDSFDLVVVAVGKNHYSGVLPYLAANISTPNILFIGNNAKGPNEQTRLLGGERVLMGFLDVCGLMQGRVVQYKPREKPIITMGELDGGETERVKWIKEMFEDAGFTVNISTSIEAWLKYHAALIVPLAGAYWCADCNLEEMTRDDKGLNLMVNAVRETVSVLKGKGYANVSESLKRLEWVPQPLQAMYARRLLNNGDVEYVFLNYKAMKPEVIKLGSELREINRDADTPAFTETLEILNAK
jgi:2-dehydropantoate 2-reductase